MSEIMMGVLSMPDELFWRDDPLTRSQHNSIRKEAADTIESQAARIAELEAQKLKLEQALGEAYQHLCDSSLIASRLAPLANKDN